MNTYRHTQFGTVNVVIAVAVIPLVILPLWLTGLAIIALLSLGVLLVILVLFSSLTVEIDSEHLRIHFGIGLIRERFLLDQIETCRPVRNSWLHGWGIRLTSHGWLYNVSGTGCGGVEDEERQDLPHRHGRAEGFGRCASGGAGGLKASVGVVSRGLNQVSFNTAKITPTPDTNSPDSPSKL